MTEETKQKIQKIAQHYGYDTQSRQRIEEMAELTQAINKFWRNQLDCGRKTFPKDDMDMPFLTADYENLVEEIADVQIMLWQLEYLLHTTAIPSIIQQKLDRQIERIKSSEKEVI